MKDITKTILSPKDFSILTDKTTQTIESNPKDTMAGFLGMLLGRPGTSLLRNY